MIFYNINEFYYYLYFQLYILNITFFITVFLCIIRTVNGFTIPEAAYSKETSSGIDTAWYALVVAYSA